MKILQAMAVGEIMGRSSAPTHACCIIIVVQSIPLVSLGIVWPQGHGEGEGLGKRCVPSCVRKPM